eukprot:CAMPEP_0201944914 /NCGR_PEP_ID=MMETSP0903-20130614/53631_1 /ASSEMBLY_ACC=CAM_ASM_000552 /TAXON_ID=420261 /ORGANISM="Thalassiosira antarctica, Strain CCMP982" /LENGTH=516 /DNA_ID=CAMNT_0048487969 /DNA_START=97 /DNA_END=1648 /DNA_ORIENTATION=-
MPNPKLIKLGVICLVVAAIALGIGIGIWTKNKDNNSAGSSFKSKEIDVFDSIYDIDCEERRIRTVTAPGNEEYPIAVPTKRRTLTRRLGKEAVQTASETGPKVVSASSKTSKSPGGLVRKQCKRHPRQDRKWYQPPVRLRSLRGRRAERASPPRVRNQRRQVQLYRSNWNMYGTFPLYLTLCRNRNHLPTNILLPTIRIVSSQASRATSVHRKEVEMSALPLTSMVQPNGGSSDMKNAESLVRRQCRRHHNEDLTWEHPSLQATLAATKCNESGKTKQSTVGTSKSSSDSNSNESGKTKQSTVGTSKSSSDSGSNESDKTKQSKGSKSKSNAPTTCKSSEGSKSSKKSKDSSTRPSKPSGSEDITTLIPQATTRPTAFSRPLVPAVTNVPTSSSYSPTSGSTQKGTPPIFSTTTNSPASDSPTPSPSDKPVTLPPTPFPTPDPTTPAPVTPFPTSPEPTTPPPTPEPTNTPTNDPTPSPIKIATIITDAPTSGSTPTVSTDITGPPTKPGRDGLRL